MTSPPKSQWTTILEQNPGHSAWYIERFRSMHQSGQDIVGEARFLDAMLPRGGRVLDAGCGSGRHSGYLHRAGHQVVGVDGDPALIAAAALDHPGPTYLVQDLAVLDLASAEPAPADHDDDAADDTDLRASLASVAASRFDAVLCAGNVMTFLHPETRVEVLRRLGAVLAADGRLVVGFGAGREYAFSNFLDDVTAAGLTPDLLLSSWDLRQFTDDSGFLVAVLVPGSATPA